MSAAPFSPEAHRIYSRWVREGDRSSKAVMYAIREAFCAGVDVGRASPMTELAQWIVDDAADADEQVREYAASVAGRIRDKVGRGT